MKLVKNYNSFITESETEQRKVITNSDFEMMEDILVDMHDRFQKLVYVNLAEDPIENHYHSDFISLRRESEKSLLLKVVFGGSANQLHSDEVIALQQAGVRDFEGKAELSEISTYIDENLKPRALRFGFKIEMMPFTRIYNPNNWDVLWMGHSRITKIN